MHATHEATRESRSADRGQKRNIEHGKQATQGPEMLLEMATRELIVQARQHPYRTLGAALSAGYVVGAGLPFFAVRLLRTMLVRSAAQAVLSHTIDGQSVIRTALAATTSVPVK